MQHMFKYMAYSLEQKWLQDKGDNNIYRAIKLNNSNFNTSALVKTPV